MEYPMIAPGPVQKLRGRVVRRLYGKGTKSEREAVLLETEDGAFLLRKRGGPSFGDSSFDALVGELVECTGTLLETTLLVDRVDVVSP
jgi:hypothetical protein